MESALPLRRAATGSAILLTTLCTLTFVTKVSQQWFEWVHAPDAYAAKLLHGATALRVIIALDDVFIALYVATAILFVQFLGGVRKSPLYLVAMVFGVVAGVLDLEENHHLLALLRVAEAGLPVPLEDILRRSDLSQLKWMLGHASFALIGLAMQPKRMEAHLFRASLVFVQLPIGALTWVVTEGGLQTALIWVRYGSLIAGFVAVAWLSAAPRPARDVAFASGSGAPA
jgi:hypothetical protein